MTISAITVTPNEGGFRASAIIESEKGPNVELWFEVDGGIEPPSPTMAATAFLAACLPCAVWLEEDLTIEEPIDRQIALRLPILARGYARLHVRQRVIAVHATPGTSPIPDNRIVGSSFSGGVDSFYTLMANQDPNGLTPVGALVTGLGFDTNHDDDAKNARLRETAGAVSSELGIEHFWVRTNFKPFFKPYADWNRVTHGACLIAFAFLLSSRLHTYLVPASAPVDRLYRWGTHAVMDAAWISDPTRVIVDGWDIHRNDKLKLIADWPLALKWLRVCARNRDTINCGHCEKCLRTMALLELDGRGDGPLPFPHRLTAAMLRNVHISQIRELYWWSRMQAQARNDPQYAWMVGPISVLTWKARGRSIRYRIRDWRQGKKAVDDPQW